METNVDLSSAVQVARRRAWIVLLSLAAALAAAYGVTRLIPPSYEATTTLFVGGNFPGGEPAIDLQYASLAQSLVTSYAGLAETRAVAEAGARGAGLTPGQVIGHIEAETLPGLQILKLRARAGSPQLAAGIANAVAAALTARVAGLNGTSSTQIGVQLIDLAIPPAAPVSPRLLLNLLFGGLVGLLAGVGLARGAERLDGRIRTAAQVEQELGLPVLGVVPKIRRRILRGEALARHAHQEIAEPYRGVAVTLQSIVSPGDQRRILITSARPKEGKTTAAAHLALALTEDNRQLALIEGDLRRPSLRRHFPSPGLLDLNVLYGTPDCQLPPSASVCPGLKVVAAGELRHADVGLILRAPEFERVLERALDDCDHVLIDGPPVLTVSDASVLARHADTVVIVVRAGVTSAEDVRAAQAAFKRLGVDIAGVVLVGTRPARRGRYYYGGRGHVSPVRPLIHEVTPLKEVNER